MRGALGRTGRGATRRRRTLIIIAVAAAVAAALVATVLVPRLSGPPPIATKAVGVWQEIDSQQAYRLEIRRDTRMEGTVYDIVYPRSFLPQAPFYAYLADDTIAIWGENTQDIRWVVSYDESTDTLTVTRPGGNETHRLKRR